MRRRFFVDALSEVDFVERVIDAGLDEDQIVVEYVEPDGVGEMIAVSFSTLLDKDEVERALRAKLEDAGFNTYSYDEWLAVDCGDDS